jgi:hypothetical protein
VTVRDMSIEGEVVGNETLRTEVRQSLSLLLLTGLTAAAVLGLGLLGAYLLG